MSAAKPQMMNPLLTESTPIGPVPDRPLDEHYWDILLASFPVPSALLDPNNRFVCVNDAWDRLDALLPLRPAIMDQLSTELEGPRDRILTGFLALGSQPCRIAQLSPIVGSRIRLLSLMSLESSSQQLLYPAASEALQRGALLLNLKRNQCFLSSVAMKIFCDDEKHFGGLQPAKIDILGSFVSPDPIVEATRAIEKGTINSYELKTSIRSSTGQQKWIKLFLEPFFHLGQQQGIRGICTEITKEHERSLRLEKIFASLNAHRLLTTGDQKGRITWANDEFCAKIGFTLDELLGQPYTLLKSGHHPDSFFTSMWQTVKSGKTWRGCIRNLKKNGELCEFDTLIIPLTEGAPSPASGSTFFLTIAEDVSEKLKAEFDLENERKFLATRSKFAQIGEISSGIAHEIANPLTIVMGQLQGLAKSLQNKDIAGGLLRLSRAHEAADRITRIIANLKKLSRMEGNESLTLCSVNEVVEDALEFVSARLRQAGIRLDNCVPADQWAWARSAELTQVIVNLINNAADAIQEKKDSPWIRIESRCQGRHDPFVSIAVLDSGQGIPKDIETRIFDPFFTTKPMGKGTGLGLSLSKSIIERMNGSLRYCDQSGHTCFYVQLHNGCFQKNRTEVEPCAPTRSVP